MNELPLLTSRQTSRAELLTLHDHKNTISGFKGERRCNCSPTTQANRRVGLKLGNRGKRQQAFYAQTQHSTSYSCPLAFQSGRAAHTADLKHILESHYKTGGTALFGTFGMAVKNAQSPAYFYDPKEEFRRSQAWAAAEQQHGKFKSITQAMASSAWGEFTTTEAKPASYQDWDMTRRLDAAGEAQTYVFTARDLNRLMKRVGVTLAGYVLATEIEVTPTASPNGSPTAWWGKTRNNVHVMFLLLLEDNSITEKQRRALLEGLHRRWAKSVSRHGFRSSLAGSNLQVLRRDEDDWTKLAAYVSKRTSVNADPAGLGASFWEALRDSAKGDVRATQWWKNFEGAVRGRKGMFRVSQSLMTRYQVKEAREARREAWQSSRPEPVAIAWFDSVDWWTMTSTFPELREQLLLVAEQDGVEGCRQFLTDNRIRFFSSEETHQFKTDAWSQLRAAQSRRNAA